MLSFPNCKINIGLNILRKRADGFHDLETVFYPIYKLHDAVEILPLTHTVSSGSIFNISGLPVQGDTSTNLCTKAYQLIIKDYPQVAAINMHLYKSIPMGAGLGGGSADGAFVLTMLNNLFKLQLTNEQLSNYALQLGSDCPFFIHNKPCFATSRGEIITPLTLDLMGYSIVLINPGIHINTGWAFGQITPKEPSSSLRLAIEQPIENWKHHIVNDFEPAAIQLHPIIGTIKDSLYQSGSVYAAMSGSGSTVFGVFKKGSLPITNLYPQFTSFQLDL